jgi:hypothetical protein
MQIKSRNTSQGTTHTRNSYSHASPSFSSSLTHSSGSAIHLSRSVEERGIKRVKRILTASTTNCSDSTATRKRFSCQTQRIFGMSDPPFMSLDVPVPAQAFRLSRKRTMLCTRSLTGYTASGESWLKEKQLNLPILIEFNAIPPDISSEEPLVALTTCAQ